VTACPICQLTVTQGRLFVVPRGDILELGDRVLERHLAKWLQRFRMWPGVVDVARRLVAVAIASLVVVILHRPTTPRQSIPVARISGKNWHYGLSFPVHNSSTIERLIQCESHGRNISRIHYDGQTTLGILQFKSSTWSEMERRFNYYGDPRNPPEAIHMADMMISSGLIARWTCARSLGMTK
jgi:hypothetical protein